VGLDLIVRWASALPVRRALALQEFGRDGLDDPKAVAMLAEEPGHFVIEIAGFPPMMNGPELEQDLKKTELLLPRRRPAKPVSVEVTYVTARLTFERAESLDPRSGVAGLNLGSPYLPIEEEFKLQSMTYEGRLEL
jgi:hypothetical protein